MAVAAMSLVVAEQAVATGRPSAADWKAFSAAAKRKLSSEELDAFAKLKKTKAKSETIFFPENGMMEVGQNAALEVRVVWQLRFRLSVGEQQLLEFLLTH